MLDLATAKAFVRVTNDAEDGVIAIMLNSAIAQVERMTGHLLTEREVVELVSPRRMAESRGIQLFKAPVREITSIEYLDGADPATDTVTINGWQLVEGTPSRLLPAWGESWPILSTGQALRVTYSAGFAANSVPPELEEAVLKLVSHAFLHRGDDNVKAPDLDHLIGDYGPLGIA